MGSQLDDTRFVATDGEPPRRREVELRPGERFAGRYEIGDKLGSGGMGAVYRVRDLRLGEDVALKVLTLATDESIEDFQREVRLSRRVTHPNVARTYDLGEHDGAHFLTMEYIAGTSLARVLEDNGPLATARALELGDAIAAGLDAAHRAGVIHRDLKPGNVLVGEDGRIALTDFGIARPVRPDAADTETGPLVATPQYTAPEQLEGHAGDARSDLYALALILFEMVTGSRPFSGPDKIAAATARLRERAPDPRTLAPVPDPLAELILRCLERSPNARLQEVAALRAALGGIAAGTEPSAQRASTSPGIPYAPMSPGSQTLAVLPFEFRGAEDQAYLGAGVAEELIDLLSRTRGLRVLSLGATRRYADDRDPGRMGRELGADAVVDGTLQLAGERVRISARLVEADSGVQRWSDRFDGALQDVFSLQESVGRRVAESLRLELDAASHRRSAPQEAIALYLRARRLLRSDVMVRAEEAVELLERCLEQAPSFSLARPAHAIASIRAWWEINNLRVGDPASRARSAARRARDEAPELADTHLAGAMLAIQEGAFRDAAGSLARALEIAPTLAEAHQMLGEFQLESGKFEEGARRLQLSLELDPTLNLARFALGRFAAVRGDFDTAAAYTARAADSADAPATLPVLFHEVRFAMWRDRTEEARRAIEGIRALPGELVDRVAAVLAVGVGEGSLADAHRELDELSMMLANARFMSLMRQVAVEAFVAAGARDAALDALREVAEGPLIDVGWIRGCALLEPLKDSPVYALALAAVEHRAAEIWRR